MFSRLVESPGMLSISLILLFMEVGSLILCAAIIVQYERVTRKTAALIRSCGGNPPLTRLASILYTICVIGIGIITAVLYIFQPHLL